MAASEGEEEQQRLELAEQDKNKLLSLEKEFFRSCNVIRQNGIELRELRYCLVQELLDLEVKKGLKRDTELGKRIEELQVQQTDLHVLTFIIGWVRFI